MHGIEFLLPVRITSKSMCSPIEIVARMRLIDPKSIRADTFGPMAGDRASISEGINII